MTLSKFIIILGVVLLTAGSLMWIFEQNWQWFAAGVSVFLGCLITGAVLSTDPNKPREHDGQR